MHTISSLVIPELYTAYAILHGTGDDGGTGERGARYVMRKQYECEKCNTAFMIDHRWNGGIFYGGGRFDDSIIFCPNCGHRHENFNRRSHVYSFQQNDDSGEYAPRSMTLALMEYRRGFILTAKAKTLSLRFHKEGEPIARRHLGSHSEEIRFDLRKRQATFSVLTGSHRTIVKRYPIGSPFDYSFYEDSMLRHIRTDNLSEKSHEGVTTFLKTLRDAMRHKWKEIHGYDIGSLFVSFGTHHGRMLFPIMNLAFRMMYPDAPNLPRELNGGKPDILVFKMRHIIKEETEARYLYPPKTAHDSIGAQIKLFCLPDKPLVRELLQQNFFAAPELAELFKITDNLDNAVQVWNLLHESERQDEIEYRRYCGFSNAGRNNLIEIYPFLQVLARHYPIRSIIALLKREPMRHILDIKNMFNRLAVERRRDAWRIKLKKLHDWLVEALQEQRETGFELHPSDVIKRRLAMQLDSVKFFLPEHVNDLVSASKEMHNCVRTYGENIISGQCNIVLMTDDRGKLIACLEIQGDTLVQAKLKFNKEVWQDKSINQAVIAWCQKANIKIRTRDVRAESNETGLQLIERVA